MDEYLAQIYGTNGAGTSDDLEKTAQAMLLQKLAEQEDIDISGLTEEQQAALAEAILAQEEAETPEAAATQEAPTAEEEAQAKFAEADFLGRVMAHSYTQELTKIAQEAEEKEEKKAPPPFPPPKAEEKKEEKPEEKTAAGPLARAIQALGGTVEQPADSAAAYIEKLAEARAEELAIGWLRENGFIQ